MELAHPSGDQLGVLGTEVDDEHRGAVGMSRRIRCGIGRGLRLTHLMDRRGPVPLILALFVAVVSILGPSTAAFAVDHTQAAAPVRSAPAPEPTPEPAPDRPVPTVSDFYPEDNNLSDCLGLVERPGCGSEARGGWRQTAVFVVLAIGMGLIFWRISVGVRRNRAALSDTGDADTSAADPEDSRT